MSGRDSCISWLLSRVSKSLLRLLLGLGQSAKLLLLIHGCISIATAAACGILERARTTLRALVLVGIELLQLQRCIVIGHKRYLTTSYTLHVLRGDILGVWIHLDAPGGRTVLALGHRLRLSTSGSMGLGI